MTTSDGHLTGDQILEALRALGTSPIIDPEHGPDQLGPEHVPYMLGTLTSIIDAFTVANVRVDDDSRKHWTAGYIGNLKDHGDSQLAVMLGQVGVRTELHTTLLAVAATSGVEYCRLAHPVTRAAATLTLAASELTHPDQGAPPGFLSGVHKRVKQLLRDTRGAIDSLERRLKNEGFTL